jgi:WhiB family redox-sensing transcriptional regulator
VSTRWVRRAACRELDTGLFFASERSADTKQALAVCAGCPVRRECLDWITELEQDETDPACIVGVWGGLTAKDRQERKRNDRT